MIINYTEEEKNHIEKMMREFASADGDEDMKDFYEAEIDGVEQALSMIDQVNIDEVANNAVTNTVINICFDAFRDSGYTLEELSKIEYLTEEDVSIYKKIYGVEEE